MRYRKVDPRIWNDSKFMELSDAAKLVFFLLLTHPQMTALGGMRGSLPGLAAEIGWTPEVFREAFLEASHKGMAEHDEKASLIAIPKFIRYNPPESPNVIKAWIGAAELLPECSLKTRVLQRAQAFSEGMTEGFRKAFREAFAKSMANQEQEQEQEQEIDIDGAASGRVFPGGFEPPQRGAPAAVPISPAAEAASALRRLGLHVTSAHPDLIAAVGEGVSTEALVEMAEAYPGKPAGYLIAACRQQHASLPSPRPKLNGATHAASSPRRNLSAAERVAEKNRRAGFADEEPGDPDPGAIDGECRRTA